MGDAEIGHAGLRHGAAVGDVDVEDAVELAEAQQDAVCERQGAAGERGPGPARHHLDASASRKLSTCTTCAVVSGSTTTIGKVR